MATLQFAPWTSDIELAFYASLASLKINHDKLDDSARKILGLYEIRPTDAPERSSRMQILGSALTTDECVFAPALSVHMLTAPFCTGRLPATIAPKASSRTSTPSRPTRTSTARKSSIAPATW